MRCSRMLCFLLLFPAVFVRGQTVSKTFTITSTSTANCPVIDVGGNATVGIDVSGTFSATLQPQVVIGGGNTPRNTSVQPYGSTTSQATITATGGYHTTDIPGATSFIMCASSYVSGTATVILTITPAAAKTGNGSGGTINANIGVANEVAKYSAAGGSQTISPDATLISNGTSLAYTGTAGISTPSATFNGAGAGMEGFGQGADNSANCAANTFCWESVTVTTGATFNGPSGGVAPASNNMVQVFQAVAGSPAISTWNYSFLPLSGIATQAADTIVMNATGGNAQPTAVATPSGGTNGCSGAQNASIYNNSTHAWGCNASVTVPLNNVLSPTGAITEIQDGDNALFVSSASTTSGRVAAEFGEHTASTSAGTPYELQALTLAGSTATPLNVTNSLNGSQTLPTLSVTPTWNTSGAPDAGLLITVTNTASASAGAVFDAKLGATNYFKLLTQSGTPGTAATVGPNMALGGTKPQISGVGTTPYLNLNILTKGALNTCPVSLTTSTLTLALSPVSLCTYTLPGTALTWYWNCDLYWSVTAGTTPTYAIGVTWAQAPSAAGQGAWIDTTNTNTGTALFTSTTTNANILASPALTTSATVFQSHASGTFTASATSGNFTPTLSLTGTGATGTASGACTIQ